MKVVNFWGPQKKPNQRKVKGNSNSINPMFNFGINPPTRVKKKDMSWTQAKARFPMMKPFKDTDKDGVANWLDCKPFDKKKQGWAHSGADLGFRERTAHIKMMSPKKFMRTTLMEALATSRDNPDIDPPPKIAKMLKKKNITDKDTETYYKELLKQSPPGKVEKLKRVIRSRKGKMDIPHLSYDKQGRPIGHEGRHRAKAADELGVKLMPVTISRRLKPKDYRDWESRRERVGAKKDWRLELEHEDEVTSSISTDVPIQEQREYGKEKPEALQELPDYDLKEEDDITLDLPKDKEDEEEILDLPEDDDEILDSPEDKDNKEED